MRPVYPGRFRRHPSPERTRSGGNGVRADERKPMLRCSDDDAAQIARGCSRARRRAAARAALATRASRAAARPPAASARLLFEQRPERRRLEQAAPARRPAELELVEDRARLGRPRGLARPPLRRRASRAARRSASAASKIRRTTSCGATVPFQRFSCEPEGDVVAADAAEAVELARRARTRSPSPRRGRAAGRGSAGACRRRPSSSSASSQPSTSSVTPGLPSPNGASRPSSAQSVERRARARDDRVDARHRPQVVVGRAPRRRARRTPRRTPRPRSRPDRQPGGGAVAAEALEVLGARGRARRAGRTPAIERPEPFQSPSVPAISTTGRR